MKLWVGVTDKSWFEHLTRLQPDEVNFWQPSGSREFKVLQPGEPFLVKLHSPDNFIVGGGFFVCYSPLPVSLAWDAFGQKNGVASLPDLRALTPRSINFRVNPNNGAPVDGNLNNTTSSPADINTDGPINGLPVGATGVSGAAYTNNFGQPLTGGVTTQYVLDAASDQLYIHHARTGVRQAAAP